MLFIMNLPKFLGVLLLLAQPLICRAPSMWIPQMRRLNGWVATYG